MPATQSNLKQSGIAASMRLGAEPNVGSLERWASVLAGGALTLYGISRRSLAGAALAIAGGSLIYRGAAGCCPLYGALGINTARRGRGRASSVPAGAGVKIDQTVTINCSPEQLYRFWRNFENLPQFMSHLECVKVIDSEHSHWVAKAPMGRSVEWDAEVIKERENELIAWRSLAGSEVDSAGSVHFKRNLAGGGTEVHIVMKYDLPGGKFGAGVARLLGSAPEQEIHEDLQCFKRMMEQGGACELLASSGTQARSASMGRFEERLGRQPTAVRDLVQEASEDSFPASDPPSWTTGH
jgi:uncharacterized membrane protein